MRKFLTVLCIVLAAGCTAFAQADSTSRRAADIVASTAGGLVVNAALTEVLKSSVHELRPDRSGHNSFPSRHTSWAFAASTAAAIQLYNYSPWWALGTHTVATAIGIDRVMERRHYGSDVIAGAAIGTASAVFADWLSGRIFGYRPRWRNEPVQNDLRMQLAVVSTGIVSFGGKYRTGFGSELDFRMPVNESWGISVGAGVISTPVKEHSTVRALNSIGAKAGVVRHIDLPYRSLALEPVVKIGYDKFLKHNSFQLRSGALTADAACGLSWRITRSFACRGELGYHYSSEGRHSAMTFSISSVAVF